MLWSWSSLLLFFASSRPRLWSLRLSLFVITARWFWRGAQTRIWRTLRTLKLSAKNLTIKHSFTVTRYSTLKDILALYPRHLPHLSKRIKVLVVAMVQSYLYSKQHLVSITLLGTNKKKTLRHLHWFQGGVHEMRVNVRKSKTLYRVNSEYWRDNY